MKYIVKTNEDQVWTTWYVVEADSADEAKKKYVYEGEIYDEEYNYTDSHEVVEIEPYNED